MAFVAPNIASQGRSLVAEGTPGVRSLGGMDPADIEVVGNFEGRTGRRKRGTVMDSVNVSVAERPRAVSTKVFGSNGLGAVGETGSRCSAESDEEAEDYSESESHYYLDVLKASGS